VAPCHGWVHIHINPDLGTLSLHHFQRSADAPVGLVFNLIQYAALTMMLAQVLGYRAHTLVYTTSDTHIYRRQMDDVLTLTSVQPQALPTVTFTEEGSQVRDLFAFRPQHFTVADYVPQNGRMKIWTPV
jgi:thymidylate synthase